MSEVDLDVSLGRKRRLPVWMCGVAASSELKTCKDEDVNEKSQPSQAASTKFIHATEEGIVESDPKKRTRKIANAKDGVFAAKEINIEPEAGKRTGKKGKAKKEVLAINTKQKLRRRTKNSGEKDVDSSSSLAGSIKIGLQKCNQERSEVEHKGKRKVVTSEVGNLTTDGLDCIKDLGRLSARDGSDDQVELTMDDMITIAQEYVNADDEKKRRETAAESRMKAPNSGSSSSFKTISEASSRFIETCTGMSQSIMKPCTSSSSAIKGKEREHPEPESNYVNSTRTGDVAQDMLDLFLGPLLKKPDSRESKAEITTALDVAVACEPVRLTRTEASGKQKVPIEKKKTSLKDKVAVLLH